MKGKGVGVRPEPLSCGEEEVGVWKLQVVARTKHV